MRAADPPVSYLVGTPKGRLSKLEKHLVTLPWQAVREGVDVKLLPQDQELYVLAQSHARINKERAMRRRKLKWLWARLKEIAAMDLDREELLMKLGAARAKARAAWRLVDVAVAPEGATFRFTLDRAKLRQVRRREGRYLLRTNLTGKDPAELWRFYIQLVEIEAAFKTMKDDLHLRPRSRKRGRPQAKIAWLVSHVSPDNNVKLYSGVRRLERAPSPVAGSVEPPHTWSGTGLIMAPCTANAAQ